MTTSNSTMHNDIIAVGSKEHPPMLALAVPADGDNLGSDTIVEEGTYKNTSPKARALIDDDAEAVHMILNGIGNDIYSTMDACSNANEMWIAIECLQQRLSINIQDVKTKLFWNSVSPLQGTGNQLNHATQDNEPEDQELEAHYMYMAKIQEVLLAADDNIEQSEQPKFINDTYMVKKVDSNITSTSSDVSNNEWEVDKNVDKHKDERVLLASLIAN
ncbi:hypothetical protein Tco_0967121 [Tanacetum coccineum]